MKRYPEPKKFIPKNPEKYVGDINNIVMRSSWEVKFAHWCDLNTSIIKWGSETQPIPYMNSVDKKVHRYFPDFFVELRDTEGKVQHIIIEIKPAVQTREPRMNNRRKETILNEMITYRRNMDKWNAAKDFAKKIRVVFYDSYRKGVGD